MTATGSSWNMRLRALGWVLNLTRINIILLLFTSILLSTSQGQDLLLSMVEGSAFDDSTTLLDRFSLYGGTALWALSIWLWARVLLDFRFPDPPVPEALLQSYRKRFPRILGLLAFIAMAFNLYTATDEIPTLYPTIVIIAEGIVFWLFVLTRHTIGCWVAKNNKAHWAYMDAPEDRIFHSSLSTAKSSLLVKIAGFTVILGAFLFLWGMLDPLSLGILFDPLFLVMLWSSTVLPLASLVTYWGNKKGIPVMTIILIAVIAFSAFNDNHTIRSLDSNEKVADRPHFEEALAAWRAHNPCASDDEQQCKPFVVVATAGGGIRAAYWTGTLLGELYDQTLEKPSKLDDLLFAISGVSGGSVGAVVYRAASLAAEGKPITDRVQAVLGQDYLGPLSAGLLYPDAVQRFLPVPLLEDRAKVFEQGLEVGFASVFPAGEGLSASFLASANANNRAWPALFFNSTWSDNGRRIVGTTLQKVDNALFKDLFETLGYDMRLSTAAHNSARFPLISPAGSWNPKETSKVTLQRLQDGGLFENYGAETALEILMRAQQHFKEAGIPFHPLVILITSDPVLPENLADFPYNDPINFGAELLSTVRTYAKVRLGRGAEAATRLKRWTEAVPEGQFVAFNMCKANPQQKEPPLGWALSHQAQTDIKAYLTNENNACSLANRNKIKEVLTALAASSP